MVVKAPQLLVQLIKPEPDHIALNMSEVHVTRSGLVLHHHAKVIPAVFRREVLEQRLQDFCSSLELALHLRLVDVGAALVLEFNEVEILAPGVYCVG